MNDWFSWNGKKCTEYGIHVLEQPPITIPAERATFTNVPGRPGSLTMLEGDDVYDDLILTAQCMVSDPGNIRNIASYLKGSGKVAFANRPGGFYCQKKTPASSGGSGELIAMPRIVKPFSSKRATS